MEEYLHDSLYFTVSRLNRNITRLAEQEFKKINLPPSYAFLLMLLNEWKELTPTQISKSLDIKPSTTTRFLDKLQKQGLVIRRLEGKFSYVSLSPTGVGRIPEIIGVYETMEYKYTKLLSNKLVNEQKEILNDMVDVIKDNE